MDFQLFTKLVNGIAIGKHLPEAIYLHESALLHIPKELQSLIPRIAKALKIPDQDWNLIKFYKRDFKLTFLHYPDFDSYPYPPLHSSQTVDLQKLRVRKANYSKSENPPILHRRETFLAPDDTRIELFSGFTKEGELIGLYENTRTIGFRNSWERLIKRKGYTLDESGRLRKIETYHKTDEPNCSDQKIERHKTALSRDKLSLPLFLLSQRGYLDGGYSVLDYGCGRGDDVRELESHDIDCIGWDPVYNPDVDLEPADIVNLGYVINVIEDKEERTETLRRAYSYTSKMILVSAMLGNESIYERFKPYKDGVITQRNTFQKYYAQTELQHYIEATLDVAAIPLAPGIFVVFKDDLEEQNYLLERQRTRHQWTQLSSRPLKPIKKKESKELLDRHRELFQSFWHTCLDLGRLPANEEFEQSENLRHVIGSHRKAFNLCKSAFDLDQFETAQNERRDDLLVYFALGFFKKRSAYSRMPEGLKRDIKEFFGKYTDARELGKELLYSVSNVAVIHEACVSAHEKLPASQLNGNHDLVFHKQYLNNCPKELRVYIGCALQLFGEVENVDLIKAHILSGKVSLMVYEKWEEDVPLLKERIKIKLKEQDIDFFDYYYDYEPVPLLNKNAFLGV